MKILIIRKKYLGNAILYMGLLIFSIILIYSICNKFETIQTISPSSTSQDIQCDLTGDGKKDIMQLVSSQNKIDFNIKSSNDNYYLSNRIEDNTLFDVNNNWKPQVFLHDISRDNTPEIILQGSKNNKCISYVFHWNKKNFDLIYSGYHNIFGILDCKNSRTPQCYSLSSSEGISSLNSFMLINDSALDTTKENSNLPSLDSITHFINLVEIPYVVDDLPNIFTSTIDKNNLSLLWNLDKDNYNYTFQNAFFYDYKWKDTGEPSSIRWRLSFEKSSYKGSKTDKSELVLLVDLEKDASNYKINAIQKVK